MTNQQILTKAIQKAIDGGWKMKHYLFLPYNEGWNGRELTLAKHKTKGGTWTVAVDELIFSHDFARALWGEGRMPVYGNSAPFDDSATDYVVAWQYHLQQMVIADDPIEYLGEHLSD